MRKKKKRKLQKEATVGGMDPGINADSTWNRAVSTKQAGGKDIMDMLGLEDEGPQDPSEQKPLKMMDLVMQSWDLMEPGEESDDEDFDPLDPEDIDDDEDEEEEYE